MSMSCSCFVRKTSVKSRTGRKWQERLNLSNRGWMQSCWSSCCSSKIRDQFLRRMNSCDWKTCKEHGMKTIHSRKDLSRKTCSRSTRAWIRQALLGRYSELIHECCQEGKGVKRLQRNKIHIKLNGIWYPEKLGELPWEPNRQVLSSRVVILFTVVSCIRYKQYNWLLFFDATHPGHMIWEEKKSQRLSQSIKWFPSSSFFPYDTLLNWIKSGVWWCKN